MIRSRLFKGLMNQTLNFGGIAEDERLKMILPKSCCCASTAFLSEDHLMSKARGGADKGDNLVWACRSCNSSKNDSDVLEWLASTNQFPSLLLPRRYLKLATEICKEK